MKTSRASLATLASVCLFGAANLHAQRIKANDLGAMNAGQAATPVSVTIALALRNVNAAEDLHRAMYTPGDPQYHQFLTAEEFAARFAPTEADVAQVTAAFARYGLQAERTTATTLRLTGLPANMERAFAVSLHSFEVPASGDRRGYRFHAPTAQPILPAEISVPIAGLTGLDSRPAMRPRLKVAPPVKAPRVAVAPSNGSGNAPGLWTVADFAKYYDVNPLYKHGLTGSGQTIGILTFASFTPSDAFAYWQAVGLKVDPQRIHIVNVDKGPGAPSDDTGSGETTLDVEQSGGVAPGAKIVVYQGPNTNQAFVDVFAKAVDENKADTISISWGSWEWFDNFDNAPVIDPATKKKTSTLDAVHQILMRASMQGQSVFAASGDGGAYDLNGDLGCYGPYSPSVPTSCSRTLSVDYPASDPLITAGGGTTLAGVQSFCLNSACTPPYYNVNIQRERVWGWDYLIGLCKTLGFDPIACGIFPAGSGGGVSVEFAQPQYQIGIRGMQRSQFGQFYLAGPEIAADFGVGTHFLLPAFYAGRNVPDISFNADPETGYVVYYTSSVSGFGVETYGGTSFVAPQLNGVTALLAQGQGKRLGLLNYALYDLASGGNAYRGSNAPFNAIQDGNNWFYEGSSGYNPATGIGTLDVANFAQAIRGEY